MNIFSILFLTLTIATSTLNAKALSIQKGWQLMGTSEPIDNMAVFREDCTSEVVAYRNGTWLKHNSIDSTLTYIGKQEGFWVLGETNCTIQTNIVTPPIAPPSTSSPSNQEEKSSPPEIEITQDVSHIGNDTVVFSSDIRLTYEEAKEYCTEYDAYLPTKDEQMAHYLFVLQSGLIYSSGRHWPSSESIENSDFAYEVIMYFAIKSPKSTKLFARCIRN